MGDREEAKGYKLVALDMDGTLLMSDKSVHPDTSRYIEQAGKRGIQVVYCSGRAVPEILPYVSSLKTIRYGVCMSGALVYDFAEKRNLYRRAISSECIPRILEAAGKDDGMVHILTDQESIVRADQAAHMEVFHMGIYQPMFQEISRMVHDMREEAKRYIPKINIYFRSPADRQKAWEALRAMPLEFAFAQETGLEMTAYGVTKGQGLRELAKYLGISMEETLAVGDADNDRAMFQAAGFSVAMGNAKREIQRLCCGVTEDNDHNGVGKAIWRYCIGK